MAYSLDLRERVMARVNNGHSVEETAALFQVGASTIYRWRHRPSLERTVVTQRRRKLDPVALRQHVRDDPDARLKDRAQDFGVHPSAIGFALKRHRITVKKNSSATANATIDNGKYS
jgi:transposase